MMLSHESTFYEGKGSWRALLGLSVLLGFGFVALLSLPHTHNSEEPSITMATAPVKITHSMHPAKAWPSLRAWQPSMAGQFMQPSSTRQLVQPPSALLDKSDHSTHPVTNVEEASLILGRREALAAAFGLALAGASNQAAVAEDLPPAGDYTRFDKVVTKAGVVPKPQGLTKKPGSVENNPALVPAVIAFSLAASAGVPALLSPGDTAFKASQRQGPGTKAGKGIKLTTRKTQGYKPARRTAKR